MFDVKKVQESYRYHRECWEEVKKVVVPIDEPKFTEAYINYRKSKIAYRRNVCKEFPIVGDLYYLTKNVSTYLCLKIPAARNLIRS